MLTVWHAFRYSAHTFRFQLNQVYKIAPVQLNRIAKEHLVACIEAQCNTNYWHSLASALHIKHTAQYLSINSTIYDCRSGASVLNSLEKMYWLLRFGVSRNRCIGVPAWGLSGDLPSVHSRQLEKVWPSLEKSAERAEYIYHIILKNPFTVSTGQILVNDHECTCWKVKWD